MSPLGWLADLPRWSYGVFVVLLWFVSLGYRQRNHWQGWRDARTQRFMQRMGDPAQRDVRRVGGLATGLLFIAWAMLQEIVRFGNDLFGLGGNILTSYPDFVGYATATALGWAGLSGNLSLTSRHYAVFILVIGSLVLMVKN